MAQSLPEEVPSDLVEPSLLSRDTSADRFARIFSAELREVELRQSEIVAELELLPRLTATSVRSDQFGYHANQSKRRPKWVQVDLGKIVEPEAVVLIPVTVSVNDEPIYGYGFPRSFRVDIAEKADFESYETIGVYRAKNEKRSRLQQAPFYLEVDPGLSGRYVRVTANELWTPFEGAKFSKQAFALSEVMVLKGERNLAVKQPVRYLDTTPGGSKWNPRYLTDGRSPLGIPRLREESQSLGFRVNERQALAAWVQIDLGESKIVEEVRIMPAANPDEILPDPLGVFPREFKLEMSNNPNMTKATLIGSSAGNPADPNHAVSFPTKKARGRYIRLTVRNKKRGRLVFAIAEMQVFSGSQNIAKGKDVQASNSAESDSWSTQYLVDGYGSRYQLTDYQSWLKSLAARGKLIQEWREKEEIRVQLVETTVGRGVRWGGGGIGLLALVFVIGLSRVRRNRAIDLEKLRQQIASDLHDDIGSNLSSIALMAELGVTEIDEPEAVEEELNEIKVTADKTIESMRDIVWLIRPHEENWKELIARFRETAAKLLRAHEYKFETSGHIPEESLPLDFKRDVFLIYKEVLNNIVRHAGATEVQIELEIRRHKLTMQVADNGKGFDSLKKGFREGNGLRNLRARTQNLGGSLKVRSAAGSGTKIQLTAPVK